MSGRTEARPGALAIVLHSHMPYVEGFGTWPFGEEWLWEAVACVYLPLLDTLDGVPVTLGLTPVLCDQLEAMRGEAGERYLRFLRDVRAPIHAEDAAGLDAAGEAELAAEVRRAAGDYARAESGFDERGRDLVGAFGALDGVELWTSAATHGLLPLMATDAGLPVAPVRTWPVVRASPTKIASTLGTCTATLPGVCPGRWTMRGAPGRSRTSPSPTGSTSRSQVVRRPPRRPAYHRKRSRGPIRNPPIPALPFVTSPRARGASASWMYTGTPWSRRNRSAKPT